MGFLGRRHYFQGPWEVLMKSLSGHIAVLGAAFALAACTTPMFTMPPGPPDYRVGFHDGCDAGYAYAGSPFYQSIAAVPAVPEDEPYRSGWLGGFEHCRASYQRIQHSVNMLFGPP
jgi:hypothetical protein